MRALYASGIEPALDAGPRKANGLCALRDSYAQLKAEWGGHAPFEVMVRGATLNNANLASVATYFDCVPGFERELDAAGANLEAFYRRVRELAKLNQARRDALLCGQRYQARIAPPAGDAGS